MLQTALEIGMGIIVLVWVMIVVGFSIREMMIKRNGKDDLECLRPGEDEDENKIA